MHKPHYIFKVMGYKYRKIPIKTTFGNAKSGLISVCVCVCVCGGGGGGRVLILNV